MFVTIGYLNCIQNEPFLFYRLLKLMKKQAAMEAKVSDIFFLLDEYLQEIYWLCNHLLVVCQGWSASNARCAFLNLS